MKNTVFLLIFLLLTGCENPTPMREVTENPRLYASGSGVLRLSVYMDVADRLAAVEDTETKPVVGLTPPYRAAYPEFANLPVVGEAHGKDHPEQILGLADPPGLILKAATPGLGMAPEELARRTGIRVVEVAVPRTVEELYQTLEFLGATLHKETRAQEVTAFIQRQIAELARRTRDIPVENRPTVFLGGVSYRGAHGFNATAPDYLPFYWTQTPHYAKGSENFAVISPEQILEWDPDVLFLDMGTLSLGVASGWEELRTHPLHSRLTAVREGRVFQLLPRSSYQMNWECQLANAWYIGKILYPDRFSDVDPIQKAEEIFTFLIGKPMDKNVISQAFSREVTP